MDSPNNINNNGNNPVDQLFGSRLQEARVSAPESVWAGIASEMEGDRLRKRVFWARLGAAASIVLLLGVGTFWAISSGMFGNRPVQLSNMNVISLPFADGNGSGNNSGKQFDTQNPQNREQQLTDTAEDFTINKSVRRCIA